MRYGLKGQLDLEVPSGLLACLERPYEEVRAELEARERELSMPLGTLLSTVPLATIPTAAVATQMDSWASLWHMTELGRDISVEIEIPQSCSFTVQ
jgi:hypothetical protein